MKKGDEIIVNHAGGGDAGIGRRHVRDACRSFGQRCSRLVKEQRARFYIFRRCVTMLVCWHDCPDI